MMGQHNSGVQGAIHGEDKRKHGGDDALSTLLLHCTLLSYSANRSFPRRGAFRMLSLASPAGPLAARPWLRWSDRAATLGGETSTNYKG
jgi:hypothetical protein